MSESENAPTFPRGVYDESGNYLEPSLGSYRVETSLLHRYASLTSAARDAERALEFMELCAGRSDDEKAGKTEEALWLAAVVRYGRIFKTNNSRKAFDAKTFVEDRLTELERRRHGHLIMLRDKMYAHDDGIGEDKTLSLFLPPKPPGSHHEIGMTVSRWRVISPGTDIARKLVPLMERVNALLQSERNAERERVLRHLYTTRFEGVVLLGPHADGRPELWPDDLEDSE